VARPPGPPPMMATSNSIGAGIGINYTPIRQNTEDLLSASMQSLRHHGYMYKHCSETYLHNLCIKVIILYRWTGRLMLITLAVDEANHVAGGSVTNQRLERL
jgi:hypothetical protein